MTFACFDDRWDDHPKYIALELEHFGLMACAITYCNRHLTDGFVPEKAVRGFGASGVGLKLAKKLVTDRIWERRPGGFLVVGYLDHNPTRADVVERKAERAAAGKRGGEASGRARTKAPAEAVASSQLEPSPILSDPILLKTNKPPLKTPNRARANGASHEEPKPEPITDHEIESLRDAEARARLRMASSQSEPVPAPPRGEFLLKVGGEKS